ncbi:MAG TPA: iron ABC transporter permease [Amycolatopsis sp.]|nr:iron ABC transporter permease [Amycolatopsis sp.]
MIRGLVWNLRDYLRSPFRVVVAAVALVAAAAAAYPLVRVFLNLFVVDGRVDFSSLGQITDVPGLGGILWNTFSVVIVSSILALLAGAFLAWLNERTDATLGAIGRAMPYLPFLVPPIASAVGWLLLFHPTVGTGNAFLRNVLGHVGIHLGHGPVNIASWWGLTFVLAVVHVPYSYMVISAGLRNLDGALEEQSRVCGAGTVKTFFLVTLPGIRNSVGSAVLLLVFFGLADYSIPVIIGTSAQIKMLSVEVVQLMTQKFPPQTGAAVSLSLVAVVAVAVVWVLQRRLLSRGHFYAIGGKGQSSAIVRLRGWRRPCQAIAILFIIVSSVLPLVSLVIVALTGFWSATPAWSNISLRTFVNVLVNDSTSASSIQNSLVLAVFGATLGVVVAALAIEFVSSGRRSRFTGFVDAVIKAPATFSIIVVTIGVILGFSGSPLYLGATLTILLIGYVVVYLPQATVTIESSASQVGRELREASAVAGSSSSGTYLRVVAPLVVPGLVAGWALLFVRMLGDLTASVMLAGPSTSVIGFRILSIYSNGSFGDLAALTLLVTVIATVVVFTLLLVSNRIGRRTRTATSSVVAVTGAEPAR